MEERLLFLIGSPRSGSTLTARMLGAHSAIHAPAEPHLVTGLAHLGYFDRVERAPYDPIITQLAMRELVPSLPGGEEDYLDACRAYTNHVYARLLEPSGRRILLDKTPAYALVLDFLSKLYPKARYIVLTRHPMAVWSSYIESFFDGDHEAAYNHHEVSLLERYVPAISRFIHEDKVPICHLRYEELVQDPETQMARVCDFTGLPFEPEMVNYGESGSNQAAARGLGDPMTVARETRPTTQSLSKWARDLSGQPEKVQQCQDILNRLTDEDLETWGFDRRSIEAELAGVDPNGPGPKKKRLSLHTLERRLAVRLRRNIHNNALGALVRKVRFACDALLR